MSVELDVHAPELNDSTLFPREAAGEDPLSVAVSSSQRFLQRGPAKSVWANTGSICLYISSKNRSLYCGLPNASASDKPDVAGSNKSAPSLLHDEKRTETIVIIKNIFFIKAVYNSLF